MTQIFTPEHKNPCPGVISVCLTYLHVCPRVENIVKVIDDLYGHNQAQDFLPQESFKFKILVALFPT